MIKLFILIPLLTLVALSPIRVGAVALIDIGVGTNYEVGVNLDTSLPPLEVGGEEGVDNATTALEAYPIDTQDTNGEVLGEDTGVQTDDMVEVEYLQPGKLLKIIPVEVPVVVRVYADGRLEVKYPWYSFVVSTERKRVEEKLGVRVNQVLSERFGEGDTDEELAFTQEESEDIAAEIRSVLEEEFDKPVSVENNTEMRESQ
jgi:hypothetical protein